MFEHLRRGVSLLIKGPEKSKTNWLAFTHAQDNITYLVVTATCGSVAHSKLGAVDG
jgi:hypothetical protein